ncbi:MAG TPA: hypothetical protein DGG95_14625 [Cytophagales bacterium]|jgi:hypothetical protein|nr:hypothetical protein [Cytophagales bacterium]
MLTNEFQVQDFKFQVGADQFGTWNLKSGIQRHGIPGTTGLTPFVVVVGSNNFLPVPVCLLFRLESCEKQYLDFLLR